MNNINHILWVKAPIETVFEMITEPEKLSKWWPMGCLGQPEMGGLYQFDFGPEFKWEAVIIRFNSPAKLSWKMTKADQDWLNSVIHFDLREEEDFTKVRFQHRDWPEDNDHFRQSSYCWAMYLRCLKRYLEEGEEHPYELRSKV